MRTIRGIYYDLSESVYSFSYDKLTFYFSSKYYLNKFKNEYVNYLRQETLKLSSKYKCCVYGDEMILISLYKNIEKRGFRVEYKGKSIDEICYVDAILNCDEIGV